MQLADSDIIEFPSEYEVENGFYEFEAGISLAKKLLR
jgi:hypothetical protein